ncbi:MULTISPECIES: ribosome hibernation-promoting factor, HPF/YfiA family [unclassified Rathayibacter]|uniref:ribosome hibernation-promoting factor, HPF/YfiA family n=1 Tax=unclassified Rathayibacter TaxID=2609250 RepID=UPI00188A49A2|nr:MULTISPECIES: ribosome-associated translation inhibitor RaiA [unclassified Rathayibacter]MBF4463372.1 ribosome-associated translation inhibitor RaiA [Rathayibacter sp. VKM Ac-2879]MBF4504905.1 ribosome-associated translation inhibitor RaiA [Rathayibacter sp. VKM Ac-2878]
MDIDITGRNVDITDRFRAYATEKSEKISHLADRALALEIKASRHSEGKGAGNGDRVELTLIGKGPVVRAEASGADKYAAFDVAIGRLLERVRRAKDRKKVHRGQHRPTSLRDAAADDFSVVAIQPADAEVLEKLSTGVVPVQEQSAPEPADDDAEEPYCPVVIRKKVFASVSMTVDDAVDYMELVGHDFYLFIDSETDRPSVVYRRKGWDYGVIGLGDEADELAEQAAG